MVHSSHLDSMVRHKAVLLVCLASVAANMYLVIRLRVPYHCANPMGLADAMLATGVVGESQRDDDDGDIGLRSQLVIFVGGSPRSGTTLARAMLDAHPDIRCGEETRVLPRFMMIGSKMFQSPLEHQRLDGAGVSEELMDRAMGAFVSEIIIGHGAPAKYLCNKDPLLLQHMKNLARMFPKSKFLLMVRDGRGVTHSIVSRNITISGVDTKNYLSTALFWNKVMQTMTEDCSQLPDKCMTVFYEKLVRDPSGQMKEVLRFVDIPWHDNVLRHHEFVGSEVPVSRLVSFKVIILTTVYMYVLHSACLLR